MRLLVFYRAEDFQPLYEHICKNTMNVTFVIFQYFLPSNLLNSKFGLQQQLRSRQKEFYLNNFAFSDSGVHLASKYYFINEYQLGILYFPGKKLVSRTK